MTTGVVRRDCRTRENELTGLTAIVDETANVVPDRRFDLPLVDQPWLAAIEDERRVNSKRLPGHRVDVEQHLTSGRPARGFRLAASLRALDDHGAGRRQPSTKLGIDHSCPVVHEHLPQDCAVRGLCDSQIVGS
jgi:hypothetical protein